MESVAWSPSGQGVGPPFSPDFFIVGLSFLVGLSFYWGYMVTGTRFPEVRPHRRPFLLKRTWSLKEFSVKGSCARRSTPQQSV